MKQFIDFIWRIIKTVIRSILFIIGIIIVDIVILIFLISIIIKDICNGDSFGDILREMDNVFNKIFKDRY